MQAAPSGVATTSALPAHVQHFQCDGVAEQLSRERDEWKVEDMQKLQRGPARRHIDARCVIRIRQVQSQPLRALTGHSLSKGYLEIITDEVGIAF